VGKGRQMPGLDTRELARSNEAVSQPALKQVLGGRRSALRLSPGRRNPQLGDLHEQIPELCDIGRVGPQPALKPGLDAFEMREGGRLEIGGAFVGQHAIAHDRVQQRACPPNQVEQPIELGETAPVEVRHLPFRLVPERVASVRQLEDRIGASSVAPCEGRSHVRPMVPGSQRDGTSPTRGDHGHTHRWRRRRTAIRSTT
jgi:hypothetical protein